jgi:toluene monooxygenase system ferredoxin subunit
VPVSYRRVADAGSLSPGEMKGIVVDTAKVLLLNVGGDVRAYEDSCPHRGVALSCGTLDAATGTLTCGMHFWQYDARTGRGVDPRGTALRRLPMRVEDDGIWVELDDEAPAG